jgi:hypothetical protein
MCRPKEPTQGGAATSDHVRNGVYTGATVARSLLAGLGVLAEGASPGVDESQSPDPDRRTRGPSANSSTFPSTGDDSRELGA